MPAVTTWWCGQAHALAEVRASLDRFALHSVFDPTPEPIEPALLSSDARARFEAELGQHPERFVARERMSPSVAPCLEVGDGRREHELVPQPVVLRCMAVWHDGQWIALPGGVARVVRGNSIYRHVWSHGGIAKDVWVLSDHDTDLAVAAAPSPAVAVRTARQEASLRSRTVDDLYWLGRYVERLDAGARQFVAVLQRFVRGGLSARDLAELGRLAEALKRTGWITYSVAAAPVDGAMFLDGMTSAAAEGTAMRVSIDALRRLTRDAQRSAARPLCGSRSSGSRPRGRRNSARGDRGPDRCSTVARRDDRRRRGFFGPGGGEHGARRRMAVPRSRSPDRTRHDHRPARPRACDGTGEPARCRAAPGARALRFDQHIRVRPARRGAVRASAGLRAGRAHQSPFAALSAPPYRASSCDAGRFGAVAGRCRDRAGADPVDRRRHVGDHRRCGEAGSPRCSICSHRAVADLLALSDSITRVYFTHLAPELVLGSLRRPAPVEAAP